MSSPPTSTTNTTTLAAAAASTQPVTSSTSQPTTTNNDAAEHPAAAAAPLPALPAPSNDDTTTTKPTTTVLQVDGKAVALDNLGPMVVGRDGTVSRIANWGEMTELERQSALRILGKRNQLRLATLRGQEGGTTAAGEGEGHAS